jgi:acyl-CoA thioesterase YciA
MELITSKVCMTKDLGLHGNLFGGNMMAWVDEAAAIYAREKCKYDLMVTRKIGEINFTKAVKAGTILKFYGFDPIFGTTSISFHVTVKDSQENVYFTTSFVFVAIDSEGKKVELPTYVRDIGLGRCKYKNCDRFATHDYNGHGYFVCDMHYEKLSDEFDNEYK